MTKEIFAGYDQDGNKRISIGVYGQGYGSDEDCDIIECMETFGGSFVQALAVCFRRADSVNYQKLKSTFSEYWEGYKVLAEKKGKVGLRLSDKNVQSGGEQDEKEGDESDIS
jgi:hypothetical protein